MNLKKHLCISYLFKGELYTGITENFYSYFFAISIVCSYKNDISKNNLKSNTQLHLLIMYLHFTTIDRLTLTTGTFLYCKN